MLKEADMDGDGVINYEGFQKSIFTGSTDTPSSDSYTSLYEYNDVLFNLTNIQIAESGLILSCLPPTKEIHLYFARYDSDTSKRYYCILF